MQKVDQAKADAVADLERRLALLGNVDEPTPPPSLGAPTLPAYSSPPPPAYAAPPPAAPPAYSAAPPAYSATTTTTLKPPPPAEEPVPAPTAAAPTKKPGRTGKDALMVCSLFVLYMKHVHDG